MTLFDAMVFVTAGVFLFAGITCVLALMLAPFVIDKADRHFHSLKLGKEPLFKGYPFSVGRMSHYGFIMLFQRTRLIQRWVPSGREDRVEAIKTAPNWLQYLMVLVYSGFVNCTVTSFALISLLLMVDRYWR